MTALPRHSATTTRRRTTIRGDDDTAFPDPNHECAENDGPSPVTVDDCSQVDWLFFRESWDDYAVGSSPPCPWAVSATDEAAVSIVFSDDYIQEDAPFDEVLAVSAEGPAHDGRVRVERYAPAAECGYVHDLSFTLNLVSGGMIRFGLTTDDPNRAVTIELAADAPNVVIRLVDKDGARHDCGTFPSARGNKYTPANKTARSGFPVAPTSPGANRRRPRVPMASSLNRVRRTARRC
ncbi:MAG: hypothetical protein M5R36_16645 [Deltaproteobacteria bacterium]|nr:hypothetical protein [Deltaproteobacteria bacterium]